jgi:N-carbamoylputrescine amidase
MTLPNIPSREPRIQLPFWVDLLTWINATEKRCSVSQPATFTVGLIQMAMGPDPAANLAHAEAQIAEAARRGANVVCLPELFMTPYLAQVEDPALFDLAEPIPGPTTEALGRLAAKLKIVIIAPIFERRAPGVYHNSAAVLDDAGRLAGLYRKMHIPDDPAYYEKYYFTPGDLGFPAISTRFGRLGILICWDQWFPEAARLAAMAGADILFYPTAIGWHPAEKAQHGSQQREAWITAQRAHAIANGVFVAAVNRVGHERPAHGDGQGIEFWGSSFVAGPFGQVLAEAPEAGEAVLVAEVDPQRIEDTRRGWPFLRDRRIDAYGPLLGRWIDQEPLPHE